MLHSLVSLLNQKRTVDFGPTKNTQCCLFFFFFPFLKVKLLFWCWWLFFSSSKTYFLTIHIPQITGRILWFTCGCNSGKWQYELQSGILYILFFFIFHQYPLSPISTLDVFKIRIKNIVTSFETVLKIISHPNST